MFDSWMEKYEYLIDLGKNIPKISNENKTDDNIIKGCQSKVWLHATEDNGKVNFFADSDAIITKGIISLLIRTFSGQKPQDIIESNLDFIDKIGLRQHLRMKHRIWRAYAAPRRTWLILVGPNIPIIGRSRFSCAFCVCRLSGLIIWSGRRWRSRWPLGILRWIKSFGAGGSTPC